MAVFDPKLICRLCAKEKEFCVDVFGEDGIKNNVSKKIRLCLPITVREDDEYPKQICLSCLCKLDTSYELYSGCLSAEHTIKRLMKYCTRPEPSEVEDLSDVDCRGQQELQPVVSRSNPIVKFGETVVTLLHKTNKRKCNEHALEPKPKISNNRNDQKDDLNVDLDIDDTENQQKDDLNVDLEIDDSCIDCDDSNIDDSSLQFPVISKYRDGGEKYLQTPQQDAQLQLPAENLSLYTATLSGKTCLTGNVSTAHSSQQLQTPSKVSAESSDGQVFGSISTSRERKVSGTMQSASNVETNILSNTSTSDVKTSSELSGKSAHYNNLSSLSDFSVTLMVQQPTAVIVSQPQVYIPDSVYNSTITQQECLNSSSLTHVNALEDHGAPSSETQVSGDISTVHLSKQLRTYGRGLKAPSAGELVGSITTSGERKTSRMVQSVNDVATQIESASSTSGVVKTSSGLSGTSSQYEKFSSVVGSAIPVIVQQAASDTVRQPLQVSGAGDTLSSGKRRIKGPPNVLVTASNCLVIPQQQNMVSLLTPHALKGNIVTKEATLAQLPVVEPRNILTVPVAVQDNSHQIYIPSRVQDHTSLGGNPEAVIVEGQLLYLSGNRVQDQGVPSDTVTAITNPVVADVCSTNAVAGATVATLPTTVGAVSLGSTSTLASFMPSRVSVSTGTCAAYPAGTASVTDVQGAAVTGIEIYPPTSASTTCTASSRGYPTVGIVSPFVASTKSISISDSNNTNQTGSPSAISSVEEQVSDSPLVSVESSNIRGTRPCTTISSAATMTTSSSVFTVAAIETGTNRVVEEVDHVCPHCNKTFPESIILHHKRLHYRKPFFSCLACGKNFRTPVGLEHHRCKGTAD